MPRRWADLRREIEERDPVGFRSGYERARRAYELGVRVRALREESGMSQEQLAERARMTQSAIARLEAGGVEPRLETLDRIGDALGVDLVVRFEVRQESKTLQTA